MSERLRKAATRSKGAPQGRFLWFSAGPDILLCFMHAIKAVSGLAYRQCEAAERLSPHGESLPRYVFACGYCLGLVFDLQ